MLTWLIINLIQAGTTELFDDEAYYWMYSLYPAWGYFDHPPMVALLIRAGYTVFQNEFGVRFFIVLLNAGTVFLISLLIEKRNDKLFYSILASIAVAQIGGIIAVPDVPLLFFVSAFFLTYKRFVQQMNWGNTLLLAVSIALMVYTKYHGLLIVFFTLISNLKLLKRYQPYLVAAISFLLLIPHLYWQYIHGFTSVHYHLFERNANSYLVEFTSEYLVGQLILAGPFIGWLLIWVSIRYKYSGLTEKALRFTLIGFFVFFMISTFKGRVEANWTLPAFVALIVLSHQYLINHPRLANTVYKTLPLTLLLVLAIRIFMMLDVKSPIKIGKDEVHQNREWVKSVSEKSAGMPVVFINSYQRPSKYWFYGKQPALGMNTPAYRRNNYNFWPIEESFIGKRVLAVGDYDSVILKDKLVATRFREAGAAIIPVFYSYMKAQITQVQNKVSSNHITSSFNVTVPESYLNYFQKSFFDTASIQLAILHISDAPKYYQSATTVKEIRQSVSDLEVHFAVQLPKGMYNARLGISSAIPGHPTLNSTSFRLYVD